MDRGCNEALSSPPAFTPTKDDSTGWTPGGMAGVRCCADEPMLGTPCLVPHAWYPLPHHACGFSSLRGIGLADKGDGTVKGMGRCWMSADDGGVLCGGSVRVG